MDEDVRDALVTGYEPLIPSIRLPDPDDRHVVAAAIRAGAQVIVTTNERDFPNEVSGGAIDRIEERLGLVGQPRAIVFHEKDGRRHAHAVWSRIDAGAMKAINLPFYKSRLRDVARELYLEHGWRMPAGLANSKDRDPTNFSLEEWQQAKRVGHDPKALKQLFQECWVSADSGKAFAAGLAVARVRARARRSTRLRRGGLSRRGLCHCPLRRRAHGRGQSAPRRCREAAVHRAS